MKILDLIKHPNSVKIGDVCPNIEPNVTEDTVFLLDGEAVGFYIADIGKHSEKAIQLATLANAELRSDRVPKTKMDRKKFLGNGQYRVITQYSTILGFVPPKPHMRRNYPTMSSVHNVESARMFIKAMLMLCHEGEEIIRKLTPSIFERQERIISENVPTKYRFGRLFTSSISNYNISAPYHQDNANLRGSVNIIIAKKAGATGGHTTVPDYGLTVNSCDNSMLVYPAWANIHAVTPIEPHEDGGYRNSLVFYPLKYTGVQK